MKVYNMAVICGLIVALCSILFPGYAQAGAARCVIERSADVFFEHDTDESLFGHSMTAFNIARARSKKYNAKMPMQLGNIGEAVVGVENIAVVTSGDAATGCVMVDSVYTDFIVSHRINIASEHDEGTCVYESLHEMEAGLMQQDHEIANELIQSFRQDLTVEFGEGQERPAAKGTDIDAARRQVEAEIGQRIRDKAAEIAEKLFKARQQSDQPNFYEDILRECAGQE